MFKCIVDKKGRTTTELANDFVAVLKRAGYNVNVFSNPVKTTGELTNDHPRLQDFRIMCSRYNKEFNFYITPYNGWGEPSSDLNLDNAPVPPETSTILGTGTIAGAIVISANLTNKIFQQNSNSNSGNIRIFAAGINRLNATDYSIYLSIDRKHILIMTEINGYSTYLAFGDFLGTTTREGQYMVASMETTGEWGYYNPPSFLFYIQKNASNGLSGQSNLMTGATTTSPIKMNALISPESISFKTSDVYNGWYSGNLFRTDFNSTINFMSFSLNEYKVLYNESLGQSVIKQVNLNYEFYNSLNEYKAIHLGQLPYYLCHASSFDHREKITINNKRYQCLKYGDTNSKIKDNANLGFSMLIEVFE
jgi:hypothetical protein